MLNQPPSLLVVERQAVQSCHVYLPDTPQALGAIVYQNQFYSYVKFFPTSETAQKAADRLIARKNQVILTQVTKGWVLWVLEPEAQLAKKKSTFPVL